MYKRSHYHHLKNKWLRKHKALHTLLVTKHKDISTSHRFKQHLIGSLMLASTPFIAVSPAAVASTMPVPVPTPVQTHSPDVTKEELVSLLKDKTPTDVRPLTPQEEYDITKLISTHMGIAVVPTLNGIRLNRSYGLIGQEQHLPRYPGDSLAQHFDTKPDANDYSRYGMTPGRSAWGYFAESKSLLTDAEKMREKYYIAVPTFLSPGWNQHVNEFRDFFKYRKMLLVNPENGKAIVTNIADAGPAPSTGKHLGGSPEVMEYLERSDGAQRGPVLYFFVDDSSDTIPLGPVKL